VALVALGRAPEAEHWEGTPATKIHLLLPLCLLGGPMSWGPHCQETAYLLSYLTRHPLLWVTLDQLQRQIILLA
jgi:hypothetical protein